MNVKGIARYTFKQDKWNEHTDYIEKDQDGNVIGIWCNWFDNTLTPTDPDVPTSNIRSEIIYSGVKPEIKIGGSFKKLTVNFYENDEPIDYRSGVWRFMIDGKDAKDVLSIKTPQESPDLQANQIKIKFLGDDTYIGKLLSVEHESIDGIVAKTEMNLIGI